MHPTRQPAATPKRPSAGRPNRASARAGGFTLVELLVVIAIIAMLVAIVSVAVLRGLDTARQTAIKTELDQLDMALKEYKAKYGSYPPCDLRQNNDAAIKQHISRIFPRYNLANFRADLDAAGIDKVSFRPDQALVFWLRGFSNDPLHPFVSLNDKLISGGMIQPSVDVKRQPMFDFDQTRLMCYPTPLAGAMPRYVMPSYFPSGVKAQSSPAATLVAESPYNVWSSGGAPYLYWDASAYETAAPVLNMTEAQPRLFNTSTLGAPFQNAGVAAPYWLDTNGNGSTKQMADFSGTQPNESWVNPESFQIIACGTDGKYGVEAALVPGMTNARLYPTGTYYDSSSDVADDDNVTNFCTKARLGDARP